MTDDEREAQIRRRAPEAWDCDRVPQQLSVARLDRVELLRLLDAERAKSAEAERRGRIAMREEAARFVDTHFEGDDPVTRKPKIFEWQIGAHPTLMGDTIRSLPDDPPLTASPGQTSPASGTDP